MSEHIRYRIWLRLLLSVVAIALYAVIAFVLAGAIPESGWPSIGDAEFSSGQATVVPALNVYGLGILLIAVCEPFARVTIRLAVTLLVAIIAAEAGPLLAILTESGEASGLVAPGVIALATVGAVVGAARVWTTHRLRLPTR
ncbi:hypothetical protein ACWDV4_27500 [Micromonospora sp. NPDC003197]